MAGSRRFDSLIEDECFPNVQDKNTYKVEERIKPDTGTFLIEKIFNFNVISNNRYPCELWAEYPR